MELAIQPNSGFILPDIKKDNDWKVKEKWGVASSEVKSIEAIEQTNIKQRKASLYLNRRERVIEKINGFANLKENWDGYGAITIKKKTIQNAIQFIKRIELPNRLPDIYPETNGTITFDWENANQLFSIELGKTRYSYFFRGNHKEKNSGFISDLNTGKIKELIKELYQ